MIFANNTNKNNNNDDDKKRQKKERKEAESNIIDFITITVTILIDIIKFSFPPLPFKIYFFLQYDRKERDIELA